MADILIFYHSEHHGNTRKVVEGIAKEVSVDLMEIPCKNIPEISRYQAIGFASGIYMSSYDKSMFSLAESLKDLSGKRCFLLFTSGSGNSRSGNSFVKALKAKGAAILGSFDCKGYDTFGPFKLVGGISKNHPDETDIAHAAAFLKTTVLPSLPE